MIGITGVTGKLGSYVADLVDKKGIASVHLARSPERAKVYASAEIRRMSYTNTPEVVEALKGIDILLMVSARENPVRVKEHKEFLDAAKLAGGNISFILPFMGQMRRQLSPCLEIMPRRKPISRS